jgi:hypothetical protein
LVRLTGRVILARIGDTDLEGVGVGEATDSGGEMSVDSAPMRGPGMYSYPTEGARMY